jgi:hypothetical protein
MGGRVGLLSKPGQGSRFWLELPGSPQEDASTEQALDVVPALVS